MPRGPRDAHGHGAESDSPTNAQTDGASHGAAAAGGHDNDSFHSAEDELDASTELSPETCFRRGLGGKVMPVRGWRCLTLEADAC